MPQRVQYSDAIEPLVQFIEDTSPDEILDRALEKLRAGVPTQTMLTASALAVIRSTGATSNLWSRNRPHDWA